MSIENKTQVLVIGAGPVGLTTALRLAECKVPCVVIDAAGGPAARSYACALHPHSLELFDRLGLLNEILPLGRRIDSVAFYGGKDRRAEIRLSTLPSRFPFLLVLPQNALEQVLEQALTRRAGVRLHWNHRLSGLRAAHDGVIATVDKLGGTAGGYIVPHWETVVQKTSAVHAQFLVGADGHNSTVRRHLKMETVPCGQPQSFAVFEFQTDAELPNELRIALEGATTNVLWPLPNGRCRWSFQLVRPELQDAFPDKERRAIWIEDPENSRRIEQRLHALMATRTPWFDAEVHQFDWISQVQFERLLVKRFGQGPCWLVGDAAHQTGPAGVQSLNVGLREADDLAGTLKALGQGDSGAGDLDAWEQRWRLEWERLIGLRGTPRASSQTEAWVQRHADALLPCLPGSGEHLIQCARQLHLELP